MTAELQGKSMSAGENNLIRGTAGSPQRLRRGIGEVRYWKNDSRPMMIRIKRSARRKHFLFIGRVAYPLAGQTFLDHAMALIRDVC